MRLTPMRRDHGRSYRTLLVAIMAALIAASGCNAIRYGIPKVGAVEADLILSLERLDLPARADHAASPQPAPLQTSIQVPGWMHGFTVEVVDVYGDTLPSAILHHVKVLMPSRRELFMPISLRLAGAGSETRTARVPSTMGVPFAAGDSLLVTAMVHNPTDNDLEGVRIRVRLHYTAAPARRQPDAVYPFFLHVTSPDGPSDYDLPPGYSERSWAARPGVEGHIVALGGHLHRYGVTLRLENLTTGREIWRTHASFDSLGGILDIPRKTYTWSRGPRLDPDHAYRVTAGYFNPTADTIRDGGMGTVGGVFRPVGDWPRVRADHPLYVLDLNREVNANRGSDHGDMHHDGHARERH
jgi:hypothetical protein